MHIASARFASDPARVAVHALNPRKPEKSDDCVVGVSRFDFFDGDSRIGCLLFDCVFVVRFVGSRFGLWFFSVSVHRAVVGFLWKSVSLEIWFWKRLWSFETCVSSGSITCNESLSLNLVSDLWFFVFVKVKFEMLIDFESRKWLRYWKKITLYRSYVLIVVKIKFVMCLRISIRVDSFWCFYSL